MKERVREKETAWDVEVKDESENRGFLHIFQHDRMVTINMTVVYNGEGDDKGGQKNT